MYMKMSLNVSSPPVTARSHRPAASSSSARLTRPERAGAGGVDHAVGAAQVEAVGDPAGGDVAEQAGERVLLPADVGVGDPPDDLLGRSFGRRPASSSARRQIGWPSRAPRGITSSSVPVTPRITLTRSRSSSRDPAP